jgi:cytochrome c biogenesis protein CcdA
MFDYLFDIPIAFSFSAGMVAAFNPCGVAMLPAYIGYQLGGVEAEETSIKRILNGLSMGLSVTSGFVIFSLVSGFVISAGGSFFLELIPFAGLLVGALILFLGISLLFNGKELGILSATRVDFGNDRGIKGIFLFGIAYAISSLGCALPVFLASMGILAGQSFGDLDLLQSLIRFISYGLGMGLILTMVTLGVMLFRETVTQSLRKITPYMKTVGNMFLVSAGGYLVWYWTIGDGSHLLGVSLGNLM